MEKDKKLSLSQIKVRSFVSSEKQQKLIGGHVSHYVWCTAINCGSANPC